MTYVQPNPSLIRTSSRTAPSTVPPPLPASAATAATAALPGTAFLSPLPPPTPRHHTTFFPFLPSLSRRTGRFTVLPLPTPLRLPSSSSSTTSSSSSQPTTASAASAKGKQQQLQSTAEPPAPAQPPPSDNVAPQYVPLHVHSDFSLLDGASQLPSLVRRAADLNVPALALTDHGVLYGAVQLVRLCKDLNVKPIIGNEMYIVNELPDRPSPNSSPNADINTSSTSDAILTTDAASPSLTKPSTPRRFHLIVLAKNTVGYRNLVKLTTMAHLDGKVGKGIFARPCITKEQLAAHNEGLIVSSACLGGEIPQAILSGDLTLARETALWFRNVFGPDFYLEIQDHGSADDRIVNPVMASLSEELDIPLIATNDSHFTDCLDAEAHDALICIQTGKLLTDTNRLQYAGNEYFKSVDEMRQCFVDHLPADAVESALQNTLSIADKVEPYDLFGETRIPDFPLPDDFNSNSHDDYLRHVANIGLSERLEARAQAGLADLDKRGDYESRLQAELDMICRMGFSSYFLVVWDYIKFARSRGIPVGPGRGSAAGSLVAFSLRITDVDPIPFNLLFERFLNPERKSMPDIDTDFSVAGREQVIAYVSERYGEGRVAQIITFNRLTSKAVLKDVARVHEVPYSEADRLAKLIPVVRGKPATLTQLLSEETPSPDFKKAIERNPTYTNWLEKAKRIEGANKTFGIHAAGVVISATPLTDIVPLSRAKHGEIITQYAMDDVEALGLLKMDFLGLKNLSVIETALNFINDGRRAAGLNEDLDFSVDALPLDDPKTYKLLAEGELDGIFQLDASAGMRNIVHELRPSNLEDISSVLALYRPGPLDAGLIPKFIRRKHGIDPIEYDHPLLEPILKETYGIMVYQEQIMRIARDLAGYSLGQADILRRAMGKKKVADMEREKPRFIEGAVEKGVPAETATKLFDMMTKFAEYCFNKSHSTAYAYLTYQTAYLKANYPVEYSAALLRLNTNQSDKLVRYLADANAIGVQVLPPCINKSALGFTVDRSRPDGPVVMFGLEAVKAVGESVASALLEEREARGPFVNIVDLIERVDLRVLNKRAVGALILAGAFDSLHANRKILFEKLDDMLALRRKIRDRRRRREAKKKLSEEDRHNLEQEDLDLWENAEMELMKESIEKRDFDMLERLAGEKSTLGFYASGNPLYDLQGVAKDLGSDKVSNLLGDVTDSSDSVLEEGLERVSSQVPDGTEVMVISCVTDLKRMTTAKGKKMAKWMIEDATGRIPAIVFPSEYCVMEQVLSSEEVNDKSEQKFVVEEDARVIVWGKIERQSSGSIQVIVDDVQRVEDVRAVIATAPHSEDISPEMQLKMLQMRTAKVMGIDMTPSKPGTFIDSNGEVRRRRAKKAPPLEARNRVPLIFRFVDKDGEVVRSTNAGNSYRFPTDPSSVISTLQENHGMRMRVVSVRDEILENSSAENVNHLGGVPKSTPVPEKKKRSITKKSTQNNPESIAEEFNNLTIEDVEISKVEPTPNIEVTSNEPLSAEVTESDEIQAEPSSQVVHSNNVKKVKSDIKKKETQHRLFDSEVQVGEISLSATEHEEYLSTLDAIQTKDMVGAGEAEEALSYIRSKYHKPDVFNTRAFTSFRGVDEFAVHEAFDSVGLPIMDSVENPKQVVGTLSTSSTMSKTATLPSNPLTFASAELEEIITTQNNDFAPTGSFDGGKDSPNVPLSNIGVNGMSNYNIATAAADILHRELESLSPSNDGRSEPPSPPADEDPVDISGLASSGVEVEVDHGKLSGVLDAICLVAGAAASELTNSKHVLTGISQIDLKRLVENGITLQVTGKVVNAGGHDVSVLVDVRESVPSGPRKRVRYFGPIAVSFRSESKLENMVLKTKKSQKCLETFHEKMRLKSEMASSSEESSAEETPTKATRRKRRGLQVKNSDAGFSLPIDLNGGQERVPHLRDGGELLSWLSRAAEVCAGNAVQDLKSVRVTGMDGIYVSGEKMFETAQSATISTKLMQGESGTIRVLTEAQVRVAENESTTVSATFVVGSAESHKKRES